MSKASSYEQKTEQLLTPIVEGMNFELVDVEYVKEAGEYYLRAYIDKEGGITIDDCVAVSRAFNDILDAEDYIEDAYTFEVSSPGLDRPLKKERDYERSLGKRILLKLYKQQDGKKEYYGELKSYDADTVTILEEDTETDFTVNKTDLAMIRLAFDFDK